jgi:hypothetical protein
VIPIFRKGKYLPRAGGVWHSHQPLIDTRKLIEA